MLKSHRGMSIVELMIALAIGMIISGAMGALFVATTKVKNEVNRTGEQIENGRIAMELVSQEIRHAGFWDGLEYQGMADPALPSAADICSTDPDVHAAALPVFIQGFDNVAAGAAPGCLTDARAGTDILVIRRSGTCLVGAADCEDIGPYFQASRCEPDHGAPNEGTELGSLDKNDWFVVSDDKTDLTLTRRDCVTPAAQRRYVIRVFYLANNDRPADALPSLKMAELRAGEWQISTIASGIEQFQLQFGLDTGGDTAPESYPASLATVADWRRVVSAKLAVLARNSAPTPELVDTRIFDLGETAAGKRNVFSTDCAQAAVDATMDCTPLTGRDIRRHAFNGQIGIKNPIALRSL